MFGQKNLEKGTKNQDGHSLAYFKGNVDLPSLQKKS